MSFDPIAFRAQVALTRLHLARADAAVMQGDHRVTGEAITAAQDALLRAQIMWSIMPRGARRKGKKA